MQRSHRFQFGLRFLFLLMLVSAVAAYSLRPKPGSVYGTITVNGKPLGVATVSFCSSTGMTDKVEVDANGKYEMRLPPGEYTVAIQSVSPIPMRYSSPQSSLRVAVREGANVLNFDLSSQ